MDELTMDTLFSDEVANQNVRISFMPKTMTGTEQLESLWLQTLISDSEYRGAMRREANFPPDDNGDEADPALQRVKATMTERYMSSGSDGTRAAGDDNPRATKKQRKGGDHTKSKAQADGEKESASATKK